MREIKYVQALSEGLIQEMEVNPDIFVTGIAVDYPSGIFGSTTEAYKRFGAKRVFDAPAMENAITGIAIGAAALGKRPVLVHPRVDFMFLSFDMLIQLGAKWKYMYGGNAGQVPVVIRAIIGRGWGQGATHSQSLQSVLGHFPGLTVLMPAFPSDAKGLMISALRHTGPVVILEYRTLYETTGPVAIEPFAVPIGKANIVREGRDITIVSTSYMSYEALHAANELEKFGISAEIIDLRSIRPLDEKTIINSVKKTGRLLAVDTSWELFGVASEVCALVAEKGFEYLKAPVRRLSTADCPAPVSHSLEKVFYPSAMTIAKVAEAILDKKSNALGSLEREDSFKGPY
jgi:acetoin:2,6-dichlorophenolindophenol oxidoreductase subunit beta